MILKYEPLDCDGTPVKPGDIVRLLEAPSELIYGLDEQDIFAIKNVVGTTMKIEEFDPYGHAELMFRDAADVIHFIFLAPKYLQRQPT